jgi:hypothetical protein
MTNRSHEQTARQREQLLSFESVKRWMGRETIRSKKTTIGYLDHLQVLLDHLGCNPDELVARRIEDMVRINAIYERFRKFADSLEDIYNRMREIDR